MNKQLHKLTSRKHECIKECTPGERQWRQQVHNRLYSLKKSFLARFFAHSTEKEREEMLEHSLPKAPVQASQTPICLDSSHQHFLISRHFFPPDCCVSETSDQRVWRLQWRYQKNIEEHGWNIMNNGTSFFSKTTTNQNNLCFNSRMDWRMLVVHHGQRVLRGACALQTAHASIIPLTGIMQVAWA